MDSEDIAAFPISKKPLFSATTAEEIIEYVKNGEDIDARCEITELTPLLWAIVSKKNLEVAKELIRQQANVNLFVDNGSPLHGAAQVGNIELIELLLDQGAKVDAKNNLGATPLYFACQFGNLEAVKILIEEGAEIDEKTTSGGTPLMIATQMEHHAVVDYLLEKNADINLQEISTGVHPIHIAVGTGKIDLVKKLLAYKPELEVREKVAGVTPLYLACQSGYRDIAELLLKSNSMIESRGTDGAGPISIASQNGHFEVVELLLQYKADVDLRSLGGRTSLHYGVKAKRKDILELLIKHNANLEVRETSYMFTPLHTAIMEGELDIAKLLIESNSDPMTVVKGGESTVYCATQVGKIDMIKYLISINCDINQKEYTIGADCLFFATQCGRKDIVELLIESKADIHARTAKDFRAIDIACELLHIDILEYFIGLEDIRVEEINPISAAMVLTKLVEDDNEELVDKLLAKNINVNGLNEKGLTILFSTLINDNKDEEFKYKYTNKFLAAGVDVNVVVVGYTALFLAAEYGYEGIARSLIQHGANIEYMDQYGGTAFISAARMGRINIIRLLVHYNVNVNHKNDMGENALLTAAAKTFWDIVDLLINLHLSKAIYLDITQSEVVEENTIIHILISRLLRIRLQLEKLEGCRLIGEEWGEEKEIEEAVLRVEYQKNKGIVFKYIEHEDFTKKGVIDSMTKIGFTVFLFAVVCADMELCQRIIQLLIQDSKLEKYINYQYPVADPIMVPDENGEETEQENDLYGIFPLYQAIVTNNYELTKLLIDHGADIYQISLRTRLSTLYLATNLNYVQIVELLLETDRQNKLKMKEEGKEVQDFLNMALIDGSTAISCAAREGNNVLINLFIKYSVNLNPEGLQPLILATIREHFETVKILIENGANVECRESSIGATAIYLAIQMKNYEIFSYLLSKGFFLLPFPFLFFILRLFPSFLSILLPSLSFPTPSLFPSVFLTSTPSYPFFSFSYFLSPLFHVCIFPSISMEPYHLHVRTTQLSGVLNPFNSLFSFPLLQIGALPSPLFCVTLLTSARNPFHSLFLRLLAFLFPNFFDSIKQERLLIIRLKVRDLHQWHLQHSLVCTNS